MDEVEKKELLDKIDFIFFHSNKESSRNFAGSIFDIVNVGRALSINQLLTLNKIFEEENKKLPADALSPIAALKHSDKVVEEEVVSPHHSESSKNFVSSCDFCGGNGVYLCTKKDEPGVPYAFRCHCSAGCNDRRKHIPQFKPAHVSQGFVYDR